MNTNKCIKQSSIYNKLKEKEYEGSYSSLRSYCKRFKFKYNPKKLSIIEDKLELNDIIKFLYHPLNKIKEIYIEQFDKIFRQHPIVETIYNVIIDFKSAVFEKKALPLLKNGYIK